MTPRWLQVQVLGPQCDWGACTCCLPRPLTTCLPATPTASPLPLPGTLSLPTPGRAGPVSARASLVCCPLISLMSPLAPPYLSEAALMTSLQTSLLPGTPFLIDLSEPSASGSSPSRALLAAPFSSPPARTLLPGRHALLPGLTFLLSTCHCSRAVCVHSAWPHSWGQGLCPLQSVCPVPELGGSTGSVRRTNAEVLPCCCLG